MNNKEKMKFVSPDDRFNLLTLDTTTSSSLNQILWRSQKTKKARQWRKTMGQHRSETMMIASDPLDRLASMIPC